MTLGGHYIPKAATCSIWRSLFAFRNLLSDGLWLAGELAGAVSAAAGLTVRMDWAWNGETTEEHQGCRNEQEHTFHGVFSLVEKSIRDTFGRSAARLRRIRNGRECPELVTK